MLRFWTTGGRPMVDRCPVDIYCQWFGRENLPTWHCFRNLRVGEIWYSKSESSIIRYQIIFLWCSSLWSSFWPAGVLSEQEESLLEGRDLCSSVKFDGLELSRDNYVQSTKMHEGLDVIECKADKLSCNSCMHLQFNGFQSLFPSGPKCNIRIWEVC